MNSKLLLIFFVIAMIYSDVSMEQLIGWIPFLALSHRWPTDGFHLYIALFLMAILQTVAFTPHPVITNAAVLLASFQHVHTVAKIRPEQQSRN